MLEEKRLYFSISASGNFGCKVVLSERGINNMQADRNAVNLTMYCTLKYERVYELAQNSRDEITENMPFFDA